jgi:hypothetical protein
MPTHQKAQANCVDLYGFNLDRLNLRGFAVYVIDTRKTPKSGKPVKIHLP